MRDPLAGRAAIHTSLLHPFGLLCVESIYLYWRRGSGYGHILETMSANEPQQPLGWVWSGVVELFTLQ